MSLPLWALCIGGLMVTMVLAGTLLGRLPLSSAMVYLALGWILGPDVMNVLRPDPFAHTAMLRGLAEVAVLISLFAVGMQLGVPLADWRWRLPVRLAVLSMAAMVGMLAFVGVWLLALPLGAAILLGGILAPTDPVLASGVRSESGSRPDRLGFSLAGEGGLNDGTAYPLVMLGLGLLGVEGMGPGLGRWWGVHLLWATLGGLAIGAALGAATGWLVVYLRSRHDEAVGLDEFLGLGLVGLAYGLPEVSHASGFLAVFAAGLALQRVRERPLQRAGVSVRAAKARSAGAHAHHAADMQDTVQTFNEQLERLGELALVLMVGAMLSYARPVPAVWWFVPLLLLVLRPLSVLVATPGERLKASQQAMIAWFGIRGIGSVFYLLFALGHELAPGVAETLVSLTLWTVATSIILHGITAQPLMIRYLTPRRAPAQS